MRWISGMSYGLAARVRHLRSTEVVLLMVGVHGLIASAGQRLAARRGVRQSGGEDMVGISRCVQDVGQVGGLANEARRVLEDRRVERRASHGFRGQSKDAL